MILGLYHFTTLVIYESEMAKPPTSGNEPDLRRYEVYQRYLGSIKAWLDKFFSMPLEMYTCLPCGSYSQLFYITIYLHRITTTKDSAWDPAAVRAVVDLVPTLDKIIHTLEQLKAPSRLQDDGYNEALSFGVKKFLTLKMAWQSEMASKDREDSAAHEADVVPDFQSFSPTLPWNYFDFHMLPDRLDFSWQ